MNLLTDDISKLSFKVIKDEISKIDFNEFYNSSDYEKIVSILTADKRKNVSSLGAKIIEKHFSSYIFFFIYNRCI